MCIVCGARLMLSCPPATTMSEKEIVFITEQGKEIVNYYVSQVFFFSFMNDRMSLVIKWTKMRLTVRIKKYVVKSVDNG